MNNRKTEKIMLKTVNPIAPTHAQAFPVQRPNARQKLRAPRIIRNVAADPNVQFARARRLSSAPRNSKTPSMTSSITSRVIPLGLSR